MRPPDVRLSAIHRIVPILGLALSLAMGGAWAQDAVETKVKAAILVKLTKFVEWPADRLAPSAKLQICLLGETPLTEVLQGMKNELSQNHALEIVTLQSPSDRKSAECHVLYLGEDDTERMETLSAQLRRPSLLTVGDARGFAEHGGIIELVREGTHVAFRINLKTAKAAGLSINSQLLALATIVDP